MATAVRIRLYTLADVAEMTRAARESFPDVSPWMPWCHADYSASDAAAWVGATLAAHRDGTGHEFAIVDEDDRYAGGCGISQVNRYSGVANLGYWVRSSATGRGIASAAVMQLIPWVFRNTALHRLDIVVATANVRSQRVAEKIGAARDAVLRKRTLVNGRPADAILYSVLRPD
jgi:ribosomal-protein-serine acetyltransferase